MNPIEFALRRPVTVVVLMIALLAAGGYALFYQMKVDIFPALNLPVRCAAGTLTEYLSCPALTIGISALSRNSAPTRAKSAARFRARRWC